MTTWDFAIKYSFVAALLSILFPTYTLFRTETRWIQGITEGGTSVRLPVREVDSGDDASGIPFGHGEATCTD